MRPTKKSLMSLVLTVSFAVGASPVLAAESPASAEMIDQGEGVLKQVTTGLEWAQSDNGADIGWSAAGSYCAGKGAAWRLPSVAELLSLYDKSGNVETNCGAGYTCRVSPLFRLSGPWAWSDEASTSLSAWIVILSKGNTYTYVVSDATKKRALCARSS